MRPLKLKYLFVERSSSVFSDLCAKDSYTYYFFVPPLTPKILKFEIRAKKARKPQRNREKNLIKLRCCVTLQCDQTDVGSSQKTFLAFSRTSKRRRWPKLSTKKVFFSFLALFRDKFRLPAKTFLAQQLLEQSLSLIHIWRCRRS